MYVRENISFESAGCTLRGWLYIPDKNLLPVSAIIMTHGFACVKEHGLDRFASAFADAGFSVLVYDNRNFGESDGFPRLEVDPIAQIQDMKHAITFMQRLKIVNANSIGLWGASLSAGNVLNVAAKDQRVQCICIQVPFVQGMKEKTEHYIKKIIKPYGNIDLSAVMVRVTTLNKNDFAVMKQQSSYDFLTHIKKWENKVTLRSLKNVAYYALSTQVKKIVAPIHCIVAKNDTVALKEISLNIYQKLKAPKELMMIEGEHFSPWQEAFEECCNAQITWFKRYL